MDNIKNLLFDLGGVIMDIRKENCVAAFERLGLRNASTYFGDYSQHGPFLALERGDISVGQFHEALRKDLPPHVSDEQIDDAFCQFLIGIPPRRLHELEKLRLKYNLCLLSNTNPIMWHSTIRKEFEKEGKNIDYYFPGGIVTSFEANSLKPEAKIFEYAVEKLGIEPARTLFLDDSVINLEASEKLGFNTAHVPTDSEFSDILSKILE